MYDEKIRFDKYFPKTFNLHSISINNEFMVYLNVKEGCSLEKNSKKINVLVNTGLFRNGNLVNKCLYERELSYKLNESISRHLFFDPVVVEFINFYIVIIRNSRNIKLECLRGALYAIRELLGKRMKVLAIKRFYPTFQNDTLKNVNLNRLKFSNFRCLISIIIDLSALVFCSFISEGFLSLEFLINSLYYSGNFKWVVNLKNK